jgi:hypothetical protein
MNHIIKTSPKRLTKARGKPKAISNLDYVPSAYLKKAVKMPLRDRRTATCYRHGIQDSVIPLVLMPLGMAIVSLVPIAIMALTRNVIAPGTIVEPYGWTIMGLFMGVGILLSAGLSADAEDDRVLNRAMERIGAILEDCMPEEEKKRIQLLFRSQEPDLQTLRRRTILRMDPVAAALEVTKSRLELVGGDHAQATEIAGRTIKAMADHSLLEMGDIGRPTDPQIEISAFERECRELMEMDVEEHTSDNVASIGNARIARIVANAEAALSIDPDLVDDAGARIDDLIRKHVPRLLDRHAEASVQAPVAELQGVDAILEDGVELIRRSVEEALGRMQDERRQALQTEIGFLRLRRGEDRPKLSSVAAA